MEFARGRGSKDAGRRGRGRGRERRNGSVRRRDKRDVPAHDGKDPQSATDPVLEKSSRLCIKGLPKYFDEVQLRNILSSKEILQRIKILRTSQGASRRFHLLGLKMLRLQHGSKSILTAPY